MDELCCKNDWGEWKAKTMCPSSKPESGDLSPGRD